MNNNDYLPWQGGGAGGDGRSRGLAECGWFYLRLSGVAGFLAPLDLGAAVLKRVFCFFLQGLDAERFRPARAILGLHIPRGGEVDQSPAEVPPLERHFYR